MRDLRANVKVRRRTRKIKVKEVVDKEDDGFEAWRTRADARLPAPREAWATVAAALSVELDLATLAAVSDPDGVLDVLCASANALCVEVANERASFVGTSGQVELAHVDVAGSTPRSVAFEGPDLAAARELRSGLAETGLGPPENYVSLCWRIARAKPSHGG